MTEDEATALVAAIREVANVPDADFRLERVWAEPSGDAWHVLIHFSQGPYRFEHRHADMLDLFGQPQDATYIAFDVLNFVLNEPHGEGSPEPFPRTADGRYIREGWV